VFFVEVSLLEAEGFWLLVHDIRLIASRNTASGPLALNPRNKQTPPARLRNMLVAACVVLRGNQDKALSSGNRLGPGGTTECGKNPEDDRVCGENSENDRGKNGNEEKCWHDERSHDLSNL
jgi:hypothetical protein